MNKPVRGRPWGRESQLEVSDHVMEAQAILRDTIRQLLEAYRQLTQGQRLLLEVA